MKRILMISYYFPPILQVGGLRALGFSKNLPAFGWKAYVLSVENPDTSLCKVGNDRPPRDIKTYYRRSWFNLNRVTWKVNGGLRFFLLALNISLKSNVIQDLTCIPDAFIGWVLPAYLEGLKVIRRHGIDALYVSSKPFSTSMAGVLLKKKTGIPLVLDFRDPASFPDTLFNKHMAGKLNRKATAKIEQFVLRHADKLITTTEATRSIYLNMYPFLNGKIHRVYNGYFLPPQDCPIQQNADKFTIAYTGNFYHTLIPYGKFFESLKRIIDQKVIPPEQIEFLYIGNLREKDNWLKEAECKYRLHGHIRTTGFIPRERVQKAVGACALQLLRIVPPMISTKLFEALRDGIPMLAIIDSGEVEGLIKTYSPDSYVVTSDSVDDIVSAITDAYQKWKNGGLKRQRNEDFLKKFCKESLTAEFVDIINAAVKNKSVITCH